jgi:hypothetical protein
MSAEQRQWTHFRLHFWVVSQAIHLGMNSSAIISPWNTAPFLSVSSCENYRSCSFHTPNYRRKIVLYWPKKTGGNDATGVFSQRF